MKLNRLTKYLILIFASTILLANCSAKRDVNSDLSDEMFYGFLKQEGKRLGEKYHMSLCGVGGGSDHGIWLMSLSFKRYGSLLKEEEARKLIISCLTDFLEDVNQETSLRPFLKTYPFTPENISITILNSVPHPYICDVGADEGEIFYCTEDELNKYKYKSRKVESYAEAIAILDQEKKM